MERESRMVVSRVMGGWGNGELLMCTEFLGVHIQKQRHYFANKGSSS